MKLVNKFTIWYLCIVFACTIIGSAITYYSIKNKIEKASIERLKGINTLAADRLKEGALRDSIVQGRQVKVELLTGALPNVPFSINEVRAVDPITKKAEYLLTVNSYFSIQNKNYVISCYGYVNKTEQIMSGVESSVVWKLLLVFFLIAISARMVSRMILSPFNKTVKAIEKFNLKQKEKIQLPDTNTKEFRELNAFVKAMTDKAVEDYTSLKEFTENASHELQTPVAIMRGKLDLLEESNLTDEQAVMINDIQNSLDKLSRINSSLILLTRLENHEYETKEPLNLYKLINESLANYTELMEMKFLVLTKDIANKVYVPLHPTLGDLLLNNLISNAIRHNIPNGYIEVQLTAHSLTIKNSGLEPSVPTEELFKRFKKGNQCSKSIGIGLAIVKQICDMHLFTVTYTYNDGTHTLEIRFNPAEQINITPQVILQEKNLEAIV